MSSKLNIKDFININPIIIKCDKEIINTIEFDNSTKIEKESDNIFDTNTNNIQSEKKGDKIIVKGVNVRKKHVKARKQGEESGIIAVECAIPSSKVNVVCPKCGKTTKVGYSVEKDQKVRICKKCGAKLK